MNTFRVRIPGYGDIFVQASDQFKALEAAQLFLNRNGIRVETNAGAPSVVPTSAGSRPPDSLLLNESGQAVSGGGSQPTAQPSDTQTPSSQPTPSGEGSVPSNAGGFNPSEVVETSGFAPQLFDAALAAIGLDPNRAGQGFLSSLYRPAEATARITSALGLPPAPTQFQQTNSPFANFVQGTLGTGGLRSLGNQAFTALGTLANQTGPAFQGFIDPDSFQEEDAARTLQLAQAALLRGLSPGAFQSFGNSIVNNIADAYGRQVASGNTPAHFADFLFQNLPIAVR